jgi:prophage regulatory protein
VIDKLLTIAEVCEQAGLCASSVYARSKAGTFPRQVRIDGMARWSQIEVQDWIEQRKAERPTVEAHRRTA